jgi:hypothetical protein
MISNKILFPNVGRIICPNGNKGNEVHTSRPVTQLDHIETPATYWTTVCPFHPWFQTYIV